MTITALCENTTHRNNLTAEHGLSLYIEAAGHRILFDMGQSGAFAANADTLGIDLAAVDFAVLSHGHYDHGGGLSTFLRRNTTAPVYVSAHAFGDHYNADGKYIGLDPALQRCKRLHFVDGVQALAPGITLHSGNTLPCPYPIRPYGLTVGCKGGCPDTFLHEQYLVLEEDGRRVVVSGCSHRGVLNVATHFRPDVLVGGFHFMKLSPDVEEDRATLDEAVRVLSALPCRYVTGHCTGQAAYGYMKEKMGEQLMYLATGDKVEG